MVHLPWFYRVWRKNVPVLENSFRMLCHHACTVLVKSWNLKTFLSVRTMQACSCQQRLTRGLFMSAMHQDERSHPTARWLIAGCKRGSPLCKRGARRHGTFINQTWNCSNDVKHRKRSRLCVHTADKHWQKAFFWVFCSICVVKLALGASINHRAACGSSLWLQSVGFCSTTLPWLPSNFLVLLRRQHQGLN